MSATTRRRNGTNKNRSTGRPARWADRPVLFDTAEFDPSDGCDCPACSGEGFDLGRMIDELTAELSEVEDPLDAEMAGALFVSSGAGLGAAFEQALLNGFVPEFEARATAGTLAMLLSIAEVAPGESGKAAAAAADRLAAKGVARPQWAAVLNEPVTVTDCVRVHDMQGAASVLACTFHRGDRSHAFVVSVDELECGAACSIVLVDADQVPDVLDSVQAGAGEDGFDIVKEALDPAEFRWHVENALDARAVHEGERTDDSLPTDADDIAEYAPLAALLRARIATLPAPDKPPAPHRDGDDRGLATLQMLAEMLGSAPFAVDPPRSRRTRPLPAKRKKADRPAPVYQIKVGLRGAKPPIWRRLEVPADISLARLHDVLLVAFDWHGGHMHVFTTPYGEFGTRDADLGHQAEASVTLEQVAPGPRSKITYTYDFGDDWEHSIVVEKVLEPAQVASPPRCTAGRRAAPPDDCGGLWGYDELVEILNDPANPDHADRLDWLGLDNADDFDPASFDADTVTTRLARIR
jgi:hypothetical protein